MKKRTLALYESSKSIYSEFPFISGLMQVGKADYLFGSAFFVCYECYEKVCVHFLGYAPLCQYFNNLMPSLEIFQPGHDTINSLHVGTRVSCIS